MKLCDYIFKLLLHLYYDVYNDMNNDYNDYNF